LPDVLQQIRRRFRGVVRAQLQCPAQQPDRLRRAGGFGRVSREQSPSVRLLGHARLVVVIGSGDRVGDRLGELGVQGTPLLGQHGLDEHFGQQRMGEPVTPVGVHREDPGVNGLAQLWHDVHPCRRRWTTGYGDRAGQVLGRRRQVVPRAGQSSPQLGRQVGRKARRVRVEAADQESRQIRVAGAAGVHVVHQ
jgi:hypothetical protein